MGYRHLDAYRGKLRGDHIGGGEAEGILLIDSQRELQRLPAAGACAGSACLIKSGLLQQLDGRFLILLDICSGQTLQRVPIRAEGDGAGGCMALISGRGDLLPRERKAHGLQNLWILQQLIFRLDAEENEIVHQEFRGVGIDPLINATAQILKDEIDIADLQAVNDRIAVRYVDEGDRGKLRRVSVEPGLIGLQGNRAVPPDGGIAPAAHWDCRFRRIAAALDNGKVEAAKRIGIHFFHRKNDVSTLHFCTAEIGELRPVVRRSRSFFEGINHVRCGEGRAV